MPKLGMQSIRRRQLIDATLEAINEVGMHVATIAQIARRAGVSTGIISHYFRDKNGLLEATMRDITSQLRDAVLNRLHAYMHFRRAVQSCDYRRLLVETSMRLR